MESFATPYAVMFNDGDQEHDKGVFGIHSCLTFKRFQSMVGQKTGLPPAQLSTVFVCKRTSGGVEKRQNIPINEKTNFGIILSQHNPSKERDCYFMVSLKRSKKERKAAKKRVDTDSTEDEQAEAKDESCEAVGEGSPEDKPSSAPEGAQVTAPQNPEARKQENGRPSINVNAERGEKEKGSTDANQATEKPRSPDSQVTTQASAWKSGSILHRLASGELKSDHVDGSQAPGAPHPAGRRPSMAQVTPNSLVPAMKQEKTSGMVSPTSVLGSSLQSSVVPAISLPGLVPSNSMLHPAPEKGAFTLFGQDPRTAELRAYLEGAMASNMRFGNPKWCKFCAFCRERNMASPPFHWCVDDQVVSGFRGPNPAGPIGARAAKHRVAAA